MADGELRPDIHTLTGAYAVDALPADERALFEAHLEACDACAAEVAELQATAARLGGSLHQVPPASLRDRVLAEIEVTRQEPPSSPTGASDGGGAVGGLGRAPGAGGIADLDAARTRRAAVPRWVFAVVAPAAVVLAIAVIGLGVAMSSLDARMAEMEAAAGQVSAVLTAADAETVTVDADGTVVRIVMSTARGEAVVLVDGMDPAPADHAYELWLIHDDVRVPAGVFDVDERGRATRVVTGDMATVTAVGVTVEPEGGSPQPTSDPVMLVEVTSS
jgi:anti-sigma-K factor RskA